MQTLGANALAKLDTVQSEQYPRLMELPLYTIKPAAGKFILRGPEFTSGTYQPTASKAAAFARKYLRHEHGCKVEVYAPDGSLFKTFTVRGTGSPPPTLGKV